MIPAVLLSVMFCPPAVPEAIAVMKPEPGKLSGSWCRDAGPVRLTVRFKDGRMTASGYYDAGDESVKVTIDADYAAGPDGAVFGQITGLDAGPGCIAAPLQTFTGQPFAFRTRVEDEVISVADVKFAGVGLKMPCEPAYAGIRIPPVSKDASVVSTSPTSQGLELGAILNLIGGRYKPDDGSWKPTGKTPPKTAPTLTFAPAPFIRVTVPAPAAADAGPAAVAAPAAVPTPTLAPANFVPSTVPPLPPAPPLPSLPKKDGTKPVPPTGRSTADMLTSPIPLKK